MFSIPKSTYKKEHIHSNHNTDCFHPESQNTQHEQEKENVCNADISG